VTENGGEGERGRTKERRQKETVTKETETLDSTTNPTQARFQGLSPPVPTWQHMDLIGQSFAESGSPVVRTLGQ
jgi:hypothetical protein